MNANIDKSSADGISQFFGILQDCIEQNNFIRLILGKYRGDEKDLQNIELKRIMIKELEHLSFTYRYKTKDGSDYYLRIGLDSSSLPEPAPEKSALLTARVEGRLTGLQRTTGFTASDAREVWVQEIMTTYRVDRPRAETLADGI